MAILVGVAVGWVGVRALRKSADEGAKKLLPARSAEGGTRGPGFKESKDRFGGAAASVRLLSSCGAIRDLSTHDLSAFANQFTGGLGPARSTRGIDSGKAAGQASAARGPSQPQGAPW